ncbi:MAG: LCP family protein [Faecalicoccus sp.]|nr:LCP family protein [Faecalicoccus sp.]
MDENVKDSKGYTIYKVVITILLLILCALMCYQIVTLKMLPTRLLFPILGILVLLVLIVIILMDFWPRRKISKIITAVLAGVMTFVMAVGNYYIYSTDGMLDTVTANTGLVDNTVSIVTLNKNLESLDGVKSIGFLSTLDETGQTKMKEALMEEYRVEKESDLPFEIVEFDSIAKQMEALYDGTIDAAVLNESYRSNVVIYKRYALFNEESSVLYQTSYFTIKPNESTNVTNITSTPFVAFISGNDTYGDISEISRSDVNMVVVVNPISHTVLLVSIPRDMYVPSVCSADAGCMYGAMDKINHLGLHGVNASKMTVENFLDIDINYTFRVNFSSVERIVDTLGGIDVFVEEGLAVDSWGADNAVPGVVEGWNHLDGHRALCFARERYAYEDGDNQRVRNQRTVFLAVLDKVLSPSTLMTYTQLLDDVESTFETNMSKQEISELVEWQLDNGTLWNFEQYQVEGGGDICYCAELGMPASVLVPDNRTVNIAHDMITAVLNGQSSDTIDTSWLETTEPEYNYYESLTIDEAYAEDETYMTFDYNSQPAANSESEGYQEGEADMNAVE